MAKYHSMLDIEIIAITTDAGPPCRVCGAETRLVGTETHAQMKELHVLTYACVECDALRVDMVGVVSSTSAEEQ